MHFHKLNRPVYSKQRVKKQNFTRAPGVPVHAPSSYLPLILTHTPGSHHPDFWQHRFASAVFFFFPPHWKRVCLESCRGRWSEPAGLCGLRKQVTGAKEEPLELRGEKGRDNEPGGGRGGGGRLRCAPKRRACVVSIVFVLKTIQ